jgi:hypothetical protein
MAKKATKTTKAAAPKRGAKKATKVTKGGSKGGKKAAAKKTVAKRRTYHDALVVFYGGILKPSHVCVTLLSGSTKKDDVMEHVFNDFSGYFSNSLKGRFVKCEDGEAALAAFTENCEETLIDGTDFIYNMNATTAINQAKEAADVEQASQFNLEDFVAEEDEDNEEGDEEDEEYDEDEEVDEDEDDEVDEDEDEDEDEDSDEAPAPKRKAAPKKGGKGGARARRR